MRGGYETFGDNPNKKMMMTKSLSQRKVDRKLAPILFNGTMTSDKLGMVNQ